MFNYNHWIMDLLQKRRFKSYLNWRIEVKLSLIWMWKRRVALRLNEAPKMEITGRALVFRPNVSSRLSVQQANINSGWSPEGKTALCVSSDILQFGTDVKLAVGNTAAWRQSRGTGLYWNCRNTGEYLITKVVHAHTLQSPALFLLFFKKKIEVDSFGDLFF